MDLRSELEPLTLDAALAQRETLFPIVQNKTFLAHAAVCPVCGPSQQAMADYATHGQAGYQEGEWAIHQVKRTRLAAALALGCDWREISLLGPTALGLSMIAFGLDWEPGDEVVFYADDYPSNVYPWMELERRGVKPVPMHPDAPGVITWELVEAHLTPKTKLVSLATSHFLAGFRIDVDTIGKRLHERGILFCLDAIQTLGAFPLSIEHVDFLSADSHKWMLGVSGAGIVYVKQDLYARIRPILLGAWNVYSPEFVAQDTIRFYDGGRRFEPGALNLPGVVAMGAALELLLRVGIDSVGNRILALRNYFLPKLQDLGFETFLDDAMVQKHNAQSGIMTVRHPARDMTALFNRLTEHGVIASHRKNRSGDSYIRFSPHFYNTESELDCVVELISE